MMALHYLDDSQRPRECPCCSGGLDLGTLDCLDCNGTGRLGDAGAQPDCVTEQAVTGGWWARSNTPEDAPTDWAIGPYSSQEAALAAAREATR